MWKSNMRQFYQRFLRPLKVPLGFINERPYHFLTWAAVAVILGMSGIWLPTLLAFVRGKDWLSVLHTTINNGNLASYGVVLLADGIAAAMVAERAKSGPSPTASGIRGMVCSFAIVLVVIQVGILGISYAISDSSYPSPRFQVIITVLAVVSAAYLYCLRSDKWEGDVEILPETEKLTVTNLGANATAATTDEGGNDL